MKKGKLVIWGVWGLFLATLILFGGCGSSRPANYSRGPKWKRPETYSKCPHVYSITPKKKFKMW
jgi:hypothetical protein